MNEIIYEAAAVIIPLVIAIVFHEVAHGYAAKLLGDPTAQEQKRLSLNPLRHVDPIGTIILPGILKLAGGPVFGWAKPVPVVKERLRNPRFGMMAVAAAGPASNLVMALFAAIGIGLLMRVVAGSDASVGEPWFFIGYNLQNFLMINIFLALFNLLPIPPFDGSHIVEGLLPPKAAEAYDRFRPFGFPLVLGLLVVLPWMVPGFDPVGTVVIPPVQWLFDQYFALARAVAGV